MAQNDTNRTLRYIDRKKRYVFDKKPYIY